MTQITEQQKYTVISKLLNDETAKQISSSEDVPYATVLRLKRELDVAQANGTVQAMLDMDEVAFSAVMDSLDVNAPAVLADQVHSSVAELTKMKSIGETLQDELQQTAQMFNKKLRTMVFSCQTASELDLLAQTLCELQSAFFNKSATQVNVQNNYGEGGRKYGNFLSDKPGD